MALRLMDVGDVIQVTIRTQNDSQACLNVVHYIVRNAPSLGDSYVEQMTTFIGGLFGDDVTLVGRMKMAMCNDVLIESITGQIISPSRFPYVRVAVNIPGDLTGPSLPSVCTAQITKRSESAARGKAGHFALTGIPVTEVTNGELQADYQFGALEDLAEVMSDELNLGAAGDFTPVIFVTDGSGTVSDILLCETQKSVRAMRRRTVGLGI